MTANDSTGEQIMRAALRAVVEHDDDGFAGELDAATDPETVARTLQLTYLVVLAILTEVYQQKPDSAQLNELAAEVAEAQAWSSLTAAEEAAFLERLFAGQPITDEDEVPAEVVAAFLTAGHLLVSARRPEETWQQHLDRAAELAITAADSQP